MFQKYPMCLYAGGNCEAAYAIVFNEDEEAAKRLLGYAGAGESQEKVQPEPEPKRRPGRPRKAAEE